MSWSAAALLALLLLALLLAAARLLRRPRLQAAPAPRRELLSSPPSDEEEGFDNYDRARARSTAAAAKPALPAFYVSRETDVPCSADRDCRPLGGSLCDDNYFRCAKTCVNMNNVPREILGAYARWDGTAVNVRASELMVCGLRAGEHHEVGDSVRLFVSDDDAYRDGEIVDKRLLKQPGAAAAGRRRVRTWVYDVKLRKYAGADPYAPTLYANVDARDICRHEPRYHDHQAVRLHHQPSGLWVEGTIVPKAQLPPTAASARCRAEAHGTNAPLYAVRYDLQALSDTRRFLKNKRVERVLSRED